MIVIALLGCSPSPTTIVDLDSEGTTTTPYGISVAGLKNLYIDGTHSIGTTACITATITANDLYGEFSESLILQDDSGGIELKVDLDSNLYLYPIGATISLYCSDLWLTSNGGTIFMGGEPSADSDVETLSIDEFEARLLGIDYQSDIIAPQMVTIAELNTSLISCFVSIESLTLLSDEEYTSFCSYDEDSGRRLSTSHTLTDESGDQIELFVPSSVSYAAEVIPSGSLTLYAILNSFYGSYSLQLVERRILAK